MDEAAIKYIRRLENFVSDHKHENDFSFKLLASEEIGDIAIWIGNPKRYASYHLKNYPSDFLFHRYINNVDPKYDIVYSNQNGIQSFPVKEASQEADQWK